MNARLDSLSLTSLLPSAGRSAFGPVPAGGAKAWDSRMPTSPLPAMNQAANQASNPESMLAALVDRMAGGVCLVDAQLRLVYANAAARKQFVPEYFPGVDRQLIDADLTTPRRVRMAILSALNGSNQMIECQLGEQLRLLAFSPFRLPMGGRLAMITIEAAAGPGDATLAAYAQMIGLTRRETAVLKGLAEGHEPRAIAEELGVAVETVRTHIRALLNKTRSPGIRSLVVKVAALPGA